MTTTKQAIGALAMAALLVLAGCSSAIDGTGVQTTDESTTALDGGDGGASSAKMTDVTFYVSDRPGAIEDFEHLNVTITKVGFHKAGGDDDDADENETESEDETSSANDTESESMNADGVETTTAEESNETTHTTTSTESESEAKTETESEGDEAEKSDWVMQDVDNATVDLTKLQGANATAIGNLSVPSGEYDKVFVYVSDVNATLKNGESVNVKLPSSKLQINKNFELSANSSPDFVFDINVHKAGNSGKYILRPVVSESGTGDQVEIKKVDKNGKPENPGKSGEKGKEKGDDGDETEREDDATALSASLDGDVRAGENVTVSVSDANGSVANATVSVNGDVIGETDADGTLTFTVPDTEEFEVTVTKGDAEVELERKVKGGQGGGNGNNALAPFALA